MLFAFGQNQYPVVPSNDQTKQFKINRNISDVETLQAKQTAPKSWKISVLLKAAGHKLRNETKIR